MTDSTAQWRARAREDERLARIVWAHLAEPRDTKATRLISEHGHADALDVVVAAPDKHESFAARWHALDLPEQLSRMRALGVRVLVPGEDEWPLGVDDLEQPPHCLFAMGEGHVGSMTRESVALVGARAATQYGQRLASEFGYGLARRGMTVVSGGAFGIDAAAHRGALAAQDAAVSAPTLCVVAGGLDRAYPAAHEALFEEIRRRGALVGEVPLGFAPMRQRFLHRNRLIAALSQGTVVIEAGLRSGSLSTARRAEELQRLVAAVPGPVTSAASAGCHELVRDSAAVLVTGVADILELLGGYGATTTTRDELPQVVHPQDRVSERARLVWDALPLRQPVPVENVALTAGSTPRDVIAALGELHVAGLAVKEGGGWRKG